MRVLSSVLYRLPFIVWSFRCVPDYHITWPDNVESRQFGQKVAFSGFSSSQSQNVNALGVLVNMSAPIELAEFVACDAQFGEVRLNVRSNA